MRAQEIVTENQKVITIKYSDDIFYRHKVVTNASMGQ